MRACAWHCVRVWKRVVHGCKNVVLSAGHVIDRSTRECGLNDLSSSPAEQSVNRKSLRILQRRCCTCKVTKVLHEIISRIPSETCSYSAVYAPFAFCRRLTWCFIHINYMPYLQEKMRSALKLRLRNQLYDYCTWTKIHSTVGPYTQITILTIGPMPSFIVSWQLIKV